MTKDATQGSIAMAAIAQFAGKVNIQTNVDKLAANYVFLVNIKTMKKNSHAKIVDQESILVNTVNGDAKNAQ